MKIDLSAKGWKGLSKGKTKKDFNQTQLKKGIKIEYEHTKSKALAQRIAMDHLVEDKNYYKKIEKYGL